MFMVIQHSAFSSSPSASAACQGPQLAAPRTARILRALCLVEETDEGWGSIVPQTRTRLEI